MTFENLRIIPPILKALKAQGYTHPTPIQAQSIPILLRGKDLLGCAQTGTGKTAAFSIPVLQNIFLDQQNAPQQKGVRKIKALIVTPTRELAIQIGENFTAYAKFTKIRSTVIFGGVKQGAQTQALKRGVDVLVATPGRLLDLMQQGFITLKHIDYFILDEADHMLDMGFIHDIRKIIAKLPEQRQSLFFSATMPPAIVSLSQKILGNYERVTIKPEQATAERVEQVIYFVSKPNKRKLLVHLLKTEQMHSILVFSRTKYGADKIVRLLKKSDIKAEAIHGNKSQGARQRALNDFKNGKINVLVATDIAARGIDVDELSHVINYDLPNIAETYVHRIGRTGRASASGIALSFCDKDERPYLKKIEALIKQNIPVVNDHPFVEELTETTSPKPSKPSGNRSRSSSSRNRGKNNYRKKRRSFAKKKNS
ncbi:DEAD/DEAH box helicase [Aureispira anguillae]|uniref:DEAD-box ATP-dependent RNA helicase RhpA n=1 Tax=Aureispira anguillae TaxID=2864201 RepID=A0A915YAF5_9BACT|nr:DEAD/DEAH box helicase [Aureispira anguillae]BDS09617.1 DEAD/DEAH box helicase [Aureispira anguillae]